LSLSLLALCGVAAPAGANTIIGGGGTINAICAATPSLGNCQDPNYNAMCPNWKDTCAQWTTDEFNQNVSSILTVRNALAPDKTFQAGQVVSTRYIPYDHVEQNTTIRGGTGGYYGSRMNHRAWSLNPTNNGTLRKLLTGFRYLDPEAFWQADGTRVSSCEEYTYKRYRTASRFEDAIAGLDNNWTGILQKALQTGFFTQEIDDETGTAVMNWNWPDHAKNIFFEIDIDHLPLSTYPWDQTVRTMLAARPGRTPSPDPLTLMSQANDQLNQWGEDLVELRYQDQKEFRKALANRNDVWNAFQAFWQQNQCDTAVQPTKLACDWQHLVTQGRLYNIDQDLATKLWNGYLNGCLYSSGMDPCGIGPHQLVDEMFASIDAAREPDFRQCRQITGDAFGTTSIVGTASSGGLIHGQPSIAGGDYTATSAALKGLLGQIQQQFASVKLPVDPTTHQPVLSSSAGDSATFGSGFFGASYGYSAGWRIDFATQVQTSANAHVWGSLNAHGLILGTDLTVVDFASNVDTAGGCVGTTSNTTITANTHFTLLGKNFYSYSDTEPAQFNLTVANQDKSGTLFELPPVIIPIGFVPVSVTGGLSGGVGYSATLQGGLTRDCNVGSIGVSVGGGFTPYAHLDAFASAGIGIPSVLEAGIRGIITLARVDVPFNANLTTTANGAYVTLNGSVDIDPTLTTFGGRIVLFVDSFLYSAEMTLASWPGDSFGAHFHIDFPGGLPLQAAASMIAPPS
jgi:hypothetical protein